MNPERRRRGIIKAKRVSRVIRQLDDDHDESTFVRRRLKNRTPCSCWMCCNERKKKISKKDKITRQEKISLMSFNEVTEEL